MTRRQTLLPALTLFFLAPAVGELLSGSSPPAEFFHPFNLLLLAALYGSGAILARELRIRWGVAWRNIFLLGAAYGIIEEGLMVKSFFDPNWVDLGLLGSYGRLAGVNWVWSLELTLYHAVFSIAIPILLVELLFPAVRDLPWLDRKGVIGLAALLAADVAFGTLFLTPYRPPLIPYLLAAAAAVALYLRARRSAPLPGPEEHPAAAEPAPVPRARSFFLTGFGATLTFFFINWVVPHTALASPGPDVPAPVSMLATVFLAWGVHRQVVKMSRQRRWGDSHKLALAGGALGFFILLAPLQELDQTRPDNTSGMALVGLGALALLVWLAWRVRRTAA